MSVLADHEIERMYALGEIGINPFVSHSQRKGVISYGLTSYGYDIRVGNEFSVFQAKNDGIIDPKAFDDQLVKTVRVSEYVIIPPNSFALAKSVEHLKIPRGVIGLCIGKSTLARCGLVVNITPLEPEWEGYLTIEISNTTPLPAKVYANEGIAQLLFIKGNAMCRQSYADKKGKYQNQQGIVLPKVE